MISRELQARGVAAFQAEARRLHALADRWASIDLNLAEASGYRRAAKRAEKFADEWRTYPVNPPTSPSAITIEGDIHGPPIGTK